ncbi:MAG: DUF4136 domain-containing protein [Telluria sp.]
MKRLLIAAAAGLTLLLGGCATTVRSNVTTFNQWPAQLEDKSYAFEQAAPQENTLEMRSYQELVRAQLARLGFHDSGAGKPNLLVSMHFTTTDVPVRTLYAADPFFYGPRLAFAGHRRYWSGWYYSPFYDPFWRPGPVFEERIVHQYHRELKVGIRSEADGKPLFDVTVRNASRELSTPKIMPALVQSAFEGFPGPNGAARVVELKQQP